MDNTALETELLSVAEEKIAAAGLKQEKLRRGKSKLQQEIEEMELKERRTRANISRRVSRIKARARAGHKLGDALRRKLLLDEAKLDPHLRKLSQKMRERNVVANPSDLICPECKEPDHHNKKDGQPWCFKCERKLVPRNKTSRDSTSIKISRNPMKQHLKHLNPGLYPNEED